MDGEDAKISAFQSVMKDSKQRYSSNISDSQKLLSSYNEESERTIDRVVEHTLRRRKNLRHSIELEKRC